MSETAASSVKRMVAAAKRRPNDGRGFVPIVWDTTALTEPGRPTRVLLSLDVGAHASGWWRNSEYDRCLHLSVSHPVVVSAGLAPSHVEAPSDDETRAWARAAFPQHYRWTWTEPAASSLSVDVLTGRRRPGVAHVRLFLDRDNAPILPKGEVYDLHPWSDGSSPAKVFR